MTGMWKSSIHGGIASLLRGTGIVSLKLVTQFAGVLLLCWGERDSYLLVMTS